MDKKEFMKLWKENRAKALEILYVVYFKNALNDINQLRYTIDFIEKEFKINIRDYLDEMIKTSIKDNRVNIVNLGLSSIILISQILKKIGGK